MYITTMWKERWTEYTMPITLNVDAPTDEQLEYASMFETLLIPLCEEAKKLLAEGVEQKYSTYYIPKSNGTKRRIDVPDEHLMSFMRKVVNTFTHKFDFIFPDCMYAYVTGKNTKQLAYLHKDAKILVKMDIKDFFNSCTLEFIENSLIQVYPFCLFDLNLLFPIVEACMLNDGLAQGAPTSPLLSNLALIPFVYEAGRYYSKRNEVSHKRRFKAFFTIYADDIFISFGGLVSYNYLSHALRHYKFIKRLLEEMTPLRLNDKKTKIIKLWQSNGVWVTGLMINKDGNVTIGHNNKQILKATIFSFLSDVKSGNLPDADDVRKMLGKISYWRHIEPQYVDMIIQKYNKKLGMDYYAEIGNIIYS